MPNLTAAAVKRMIADAIKADRAARVAPATGKASDQDAPKTFFTKAEIRAGGGFACSISPSCGKVLRTEKRAGIAGVEQGHAHSVA